MSHRLRTKKSESGWERVRLPVGPDSIVHQDGFAPTQDKNPVYFFETSVVSGFLWRSEDEGPSGHHSQNVATSNDAARLSRACLYDNIIVVGHGG